MEQAKREQFSLCLLQGLGEGWHYDPESNKLIVLVQNKFNILRIYKTDVLFLEIGFLDFGNGYKGGKFGITFIKKVEHLIGHGHNVLCFGEIKLLYPVAFFYQGVHFFKEYGLCIAKGKFIFHIFLFLYKPEPFIMIHIIGVVVTVDNGEDLYILFG